MNQPTRKQAIKTTLPIRDIKPNPNNPRIIKDKKFKQLVQSLKDFPEMAEDAREIILNDEQMILGGNMRYRAMIEAGWKEAPVKIVYWTPEQQAEFVAKDNTNFGEWDWDEVANQYEIEQLESWGIDVPEGFFDEEKEIIEDEAPEIDDVKPPQSELGKIYQLGRHKLMCGDSTNKDHVSALMNGEEADMVFTDPPYGISYTGVAGSNKWEMINNDNLRGDSLFNFLCDSFENITKHTKSNAGLYCWFSSKNHIQFVEALRYSGWEFKEELIWNKGMTLSGADYQYAHEPVLYCQRIGAKAKWFGGRDKKTILQSKRTDLEALGKKELQKIIRNLMEETTVWEIDRDIVTTYVHPTQKPAKLAARAIKNSSEDNDIILDLFLGSGSTLSACEQTYRRCYGMELDPKYVDVIRKRYWKLINQTEEGWEDGTSAIN